MGSDSGLCDSSNDGFSAGSDITVNSQTNSTDTTTETMVLIQIDSKNHQEYINEESLVSESQNLSS